MLFKSNEVAARIVARTQTPVREAQSKPQGSERPNAHDAGEGRRGEMKAQEALRAFTLRQTLERLVAGVSRVTALSQGASLQSDPAQSRIEGQEAAREVRAALDDIAHKTIGDRLFGEDDADRKIDAAVEIIEAHADDPEFQRAFLETLGPDGVARLEDRLRDKGGRDDVVRNSLAVARDILSPEFQRELVQELSLDDIIRYTSDSASPMPDEFLVATGQKALSEGIETKPMPYVVVQLADPRIDTILQNIADTSPTAANKLLQDESSVYRMMLANDILEEHNAGIPALIRAGTDPTKVADTGNRELALRSLSQVLSQPDSFQTINVTSSSDDEIVNRDVADALAEAYKNNVRSFVDASQHSHSNRNMFDNEDVRAFMTAALEHESTRERMSAATQVAAGILLQRGSDFRNTDPNALNIASEQVGKFLGTYTDAYADAVELTLQESERERILDSLLSSAILAVPALATSPGTALGVNFVANLITSLEDGPNGGDAVRAALEREARATVGSAETALFQQYYERALAALDNPGAAGITQQDLATASAFVEHVRRFNDSLPPNQKILDAQGHLISLSDLDPNNNADHARIIAHVERLINGTAGSDVQVVYDQLNEAIDKIKLNFDLQKD